MIHPITPTYNPSLPSINSQTKHCITHLRSQTSQAAARKVSFLYSLASHSFNQLPLRAEQFLCSGLITINTNLAEVHRDGWANNTHPCAGYSTGLEQGKQDKQLSTGNLFLICLRLTGKTINEEEAKSEIAFTIYHYNDHIKWIISLLWEVIKSTFALPYLCSYLAVLLILSKLSTQIANLKWI